MARILILIGAHLCTAPRPQKEAAALAAAGHDVTVAGTWIDARSSEWDLALLKNAPYRFTPILDLRAGSLAGKVRRGALSLRRRLAQRAFARTRRFSPDLLGHSARASRRFVKKFSADLTIVHAESGLWVVDSLRPEGLAFGADFEDWFSEDLLPADRAHRPVDALKGFENRVLQTCRHTVTTSRILAQELSAASGGPPPAVVYNTFPEETKLEPPHDRRDRAGPTLHWFSQTIGPGRGLEVLFAALPHVERACEIHLRGRLTPSYKQWLDDRIPPAWRSRVIVHEPVPNASLASRIAEHDIGLALEIAVCPSRDLTITNKFFQYLQGGLAILATDTRGQREAAAACGAAVTLIPQDSAPALAAAIDQLLADPARLAAAKAAARRAHQTQFAWAPQAATLVAGVAAALARPARP